MSEVITPNISSIDELKLETRVLEPFSDILIEFVDDVSKAILKNTLLKQYPELIALAFWMRKSHIKKLKKYFLDQKKDKILLGRGVVFHIAPSNVDTIFVYSWFISLLVGNSNIIRLSTKTNIQTELLLNIIVSILKQEKYSDLYKRVAIVRYGHNDDITKKLSYIADVRVIWGGDDTIKHIRKIPIKPTTIELTFADKFSFAVIKSKELLKCKDLSLLIENFYNDSFWFGQMACSSIRLVVWVGNESENKKAQNIFWHKLNKYVDQKQPEIAPADIINKLVSQCSMAIESSVEIENNNAYIYRVKVKNMDDINEELHCGGGLFYELEVNSLKQVLAKTTKKHQTIAQYGFKKEEIAKCLYDVMPYGVNRIVPIGKALDFSHIWDGYDLFRSFCREIEII